MCFRRLKVIRPNNYTQIYRYLFITYATVQPVLSKKRLDLEKLYTQIQFFLLFSEQLKAFLTNIFSPLTKTNMLNAHTATRIHMNIMLVIVSTAIMRVRKYHLHI